MLLALEIYRSCHLNRCSCCAVRLGWEVRNLISESGFLTVFKVFLICSIQVLRQDCNALTKTRSDTDTYIIHDCKLFLQWRFKSTQTQHLNTVRSFIDFPVTCFRHKEFFVYYTYSRTQQHFIQQYSRNTTICFGPICGPSSGCNLTYRAAIQDVWVVLLGYWWLGGGKEISLLLKQRDLFPPTQPPISQKNNPHILYSCSASYVIT